MNKLSVYIALLLVTLSFLRPFTVKAAVPNPIDITYQADNSDIANPERGFYRQANIQVDQPYSGGKIDAKQPTDTLVWVYFHLENYRGGNALEPIGSGKGLDTVNKVFEDARSKGLKLIIRFLYLGYSGIGSNSNPATAQPDAPLATVQAHIRQLSPLFNANKDVISAFQFGFVGYWGEWHSSKYLYDNASRQAVMRAMLDATPKDRMVEVRYPRYKQAFFGGPLTEGQAYNQSDLARIGYYDDAFLKDDTDDGTFKSTAGGIKATNYCDSYPAGEIACWRNYVNQDSKYVVVSGEAGTHSSTPSTYALCPNAVPAMQAFHFNSIHNGYSMTTLNAWSSGGCMPEIRQRLGYRFVMTKASITRQVNPGGVMGIHLELQNKGFGSPYNERPVYLVLKNNSTGFQKEIQIQADPRRWFSGPVTVDASVTVPSDVPAGTYSVYLWLPDASASIRARPQYAIRFANLNMWQPNGMNLLTSSIGIGGPPLSPPPTTPSPPPGGFNPKADINADGKVNIIDIGILIDFYGQTNPANPKTDVNSDGKVNIIDIGIVIDNYGR